MALFSKLLQKIRGGSTSVSDWEEIEQALIGSDLGAKNAAEIISLAKKTKSDEIDTAITNALTAWLSSGNRNLTFNSDRPTTVLIVGVNGTGKTTSTAKLISFLKQSKHSVLVAAAADIDYLIIDTAGRLHTKSGLMDELGKIRRVIEKVLPVDEVLLVVDATTGQNGIVQAKIFMESVAVTGLILTKMDGSAKGGIALAIERECGIPIKFIGTGESAVDFEAFDPDRYLNGLFS